MDTATNYESHGKSTQIARRLWAEVNWMKGGNGRKYRSYFRAGNKNSYLAKTLENLGSLSAIMAPVGS